MKKTIKLLMLTAIIALASCTKGDEPTPLNIKSPTKSDSLLLGYNLYTTLGIDSTYVNSEWFYIKRDSVKGIAIFDTINHPYTMFVSPILTDTILQINSNIASSNIVFYLGKQGGRYTDTANVNLIILDKEYIMSKYNDMYPGHSVRYYYSNVIISYDDLSNGKHYVYKLKYIFTYYK